MFEQIKHDIQRYNHDRSNLLVAAVRAAYVYSSFIGIVWYRMGHALWTRRRNSAYFALLIFNRLLYPLVRPYSELELSPRKQIGPGLYVAHFGPTTVIHPDTIAGSNLTLHGVTIGEHTNGVPRIGNNALQRGHG
jgi:serine O-acetyltransferase